MVDQIEEQFRKAQDKLERGEIKLPPKKDWKLSAARKIKSQLGRYYLCVLNIREQRWFNGLPDPDSTDIILLDDNIRKQAEAQVDGYEMVYEVIHRPEYDLVLDEGQNNFVKVDPIADVGDIVILKGQVWKLHIEPVVYAAVRDNFVALLKKAEERKEYGGK